MRALITSLNWRSGVYSPPERAIAALQHESKGVEDFDLPGQVCPPKSRDEVRRDVHWVRVAMKCLLVVTCEGETPADSESAPFHAPSKEMQRLSS